jgi:Primase C terminal 2 (PriCT-2)
MLQDAKLPWMPEFPGAKSGLGNWRELLGTFDPDKAYTGKYGQLTNTALYLLGQYAIDFDVDDPTLVSELRAVMEQILGEAACVRYRSNSPRIAALYRSAEDDTLYRALTGSDGEIEVFSGAKAKLTSFGLNTDKVTSVRSRLLWHKVPGNVRLADMTAITAAQVDRFMEAAKPYLGEDAKIHRGRLRDNTTVSPNRVADDLDDLAEAMRYIPNSRAVGWREWNKIGMACFAATDGDDIGLLSFIEWTMKAGYSERDAASACLSRWEAYSKSPPTTIGAGTIFKRACDNGYRRPNSDDLFACFARQRARDRAAARQAEETFDPLAYDKAGNAALETFTLEEI